VLSSSSLRSYRGPFEREMGRKSESSLSFLSLTRNCDLAHLDEGRSRVDLELKVLCLTVYVLSVVLQNQFPLANRSLLSF